MQVQAQAVKHIKVNAANANLYRDSLVLKIFGTTVFPYDILPDSVITNVNSLDLYDGFPYTSLLYPSGNLDSIDKMVIKVGNDQVDFPDEVKAYLFHPHNNNGKLFVYHSGHCAGITPAEDIFEINFGVEPGRVIPALLAEGYTVLAVPMINYASSPPNGLACGYNNHDQLYLDGHYAYPLSLFFRPVISCLNKLGRSNYSSIYMCGLSGGGWTTSIYPAMDSSITYSFPVAGSWPRPVAYAFLSVGDFEQTYPPLFTYLLDYHEIYTLACLAPARKMLQINNRYDACCFAGSEAHVFYVDSVAKALEGTGGLYKFYLDETEHNHTISLRALQVMFTFLRNESASLQSPPTDTVFTGTNYFYDIKNNFILNTPPDGGDLKYSLLKAPAWLSLNDVSGQLSGIVPDDGIVTKPDTVSFKVEDTTGRFVVYNYRLLKKRTEPFFFTAYDDSTIVYFLPALSNAVNDVNPLINNSFYFNNPSLVLTDISIQNNSFYKLKFNHELLATDSIAYNGYSSSYALLYNNGLKLENFGLNPIHIKAVSKNYAVPGMIRFNTGTNKFEYYNGVAWINMN